MSDKQDRSIISSHREQFGSRSRRACATKKVKYAYSDDDSDDNDKHDFSGADQDEQTATKLPPKKKARKYKKDSEETDFSEAESNGDETDAETKPKMSEKARGKQKMVVPQYQDHQWHPIDEPYTLESFDESLVETVPWEWQCFPDNENAAVKSKKFTRDKNAIYLYSIDSKIVTEKNELVEVFPKISAELTVKRPAIDENDRFVYQWGCKKLDDFFYHSDNLENCDSEDLTIDSFQALIDADPYYTRKVKPYKEGLSRNVTSHHPVKEKEKVDKNGFLILKHDKYEKKISYSTNFYGTKDFTGEPLFAKCFGNVTQKSAFKYFRFLSNGKKLYIYFCCDKFTSDWNKQKSSLGGLELLSSSNLIGRMKKFIWEQSMNRESHVYTIPDTFDQSEIREAEGFSLTLRDYQRRTLSWLHDLETNPKSRILEYERKHDGEINDEDEDEQSLIVRIGNTKLFLNIDNGSLLLPPFQTNNDKSATTVATVPVNGAVIADNTGAGKTVTVLSLVHKNPFQLVKNIRWESPEQHNFYIPSRATIVVCPSHLASQWKDEALRCMPNARVYLLTTVMDHAKLSWNDVLLADVVIVSIMFLKNKNYQQRIDKYLNYHNGVSGDRDEIISRRMFQLKTMGRAAFGEMTGNVIFERIFWHRLICDEIHELEVSRRQMPAVSFFMKHLRANFYLGVTGTPSLKETGDIVKLASYLRTNIPETEAVAQEFLNKFVRRNEPNLKLPPLTYENLWVDLTPEELALYHTMKQDSTTALQLCNHHQIANAVVDLVGDETLSISEVAKKVQETRLSSIQNNEKALVRTRKRRQTMKDAFAKMGINLDAEKVVISDPELKEDAMTYRHLVRSIGSLELELRHLTSQYNFFESVLDTVRKVEEQSCLICLEEIAEEGSFQMTECGHIHCLECMEKVFEQNEPACSACRRPLKRSDVMKMILKKETDESQKEGNKVAENKVDHRLFGSKVARLVQFIRDTIQADPTAKIILFVQFSRLSMLISSSLTAFDVRHTRCGGNVLQRRNAINKFKHSDDVKIIMLSAEDSVSGLHLTEANHVIVFHPFILTSEQAAVSYEKQGIARAWRGGQTRPVTVTRFITKNTIEEKISQTRGYKDHMVIENFSEIEEALAPNIADEIDL